MRAVARACRLVDDRTGGYRDLMRELYPHTGQAWWLGVTGSPGAGKSTLVDGIIAELRRTGARVGVVAVDPTSPFSGGAILGDRIRMQRHFEDAEVFIRSVATRGALGGLSRSTLDVARVLEAWKADVVIIETVGVGQDELEVTRAAHSTLVVVAPGMGDDIQAIKAGILECADVFAVNKADRPGADATVRDLEVMLALGEQILQSRGTSHGHSASALKLDQQQTDKWIPPIVKCVAITAAGISELVGKLRLHQNFIEQTAAGQEIQNLRLREQLLGFLRDELALAIAEQLGSAIDEAVAEVQARKTDPYTALQRLIEEFRRPV
jgi:LAO/AO transport system kinase